MNIDRINEKFSTYENWFKTLLLKEYFDLPLEKQKEFITLVENFLIKCKKINKEAENIKEKVFPAKVKDVITLHTGNYLVTGFINKKEIKAIFSSSEPKPLKEKPLNFILYSINGVDWYSSKKKLIEEVYHE
jgi:hypothetical protein